ncbi:ABZJ_00895 family protein [Vibrio mangrovi]|uniref:ABZJ_00895 family protein n=1 Tax=Vibrio mangrovi TaxID=474394 RepID=A0A1Y6J1Y3_9VIBR|nr:ABZJ_00895 family protein [Vibrio mangrovi]MDW6002844.1 ABZJ_00895 family protein [Vibrio mangrovi]SMS02333.1 hypothetical protein VIM7927_03653 [Vibrio mangrovi]
MNNEQNTIETVPVVKYIAVFSAIYAALMGLVQILVIEFDIDLGSSANTGMFVGAGLGTMMKFVTENKRAPVKSENRKLVWSCTFSSLIISGLFLASLVIIEGKEAINEFSELLLSVPLFIWAGSLIFITFLSYVMLQINFGWGARLFYKQLSKKQV